LSSASENKKLYDQQIKEQQDELTQKNEQILKLKQIEVNFETKCKEFIKLSMEFEKLQS
jgi:hypothetical protein